MALRELLVDFFVNVDSKKLDHVNEKIEQVKEAAKGFLEVLAGGAALEGIKSFVEGQVEAGAQLGNTANKLGISTEELQQFQYLMQSNGASADQAGNALTKLNRVVGDAASGGKEASDQFAALGVSIKDSNGNVLPLSEITNQLSEKISGLGSAAEKTAVATKLFGRGNTIVLNALGHGTEKIDEANKEFKELGGGLSGDFVDSAKAAEEATVGYDLAIAGVKSTIAGGLLPALTKIIKTVAKWAASARQIIGQSKIVQVVLVGLTVAATALAFQGLISLATSFGTAAAAALGFTASTLPISAIGLLIALAIGAILLIIEDLYTFLTGGQSVIGDWIKSWAGVDAATKIVAGLNSALDYLKPILKAIAEITLDGLIGSFNIILLTVREVVDIISAFGTLLKTLDFKNFGDTIVKATKDNLNKLKDGVLGGPPKPKEPQEADAQNEYDQKQIATDLQSKDVNVQKEAARLYQQGPHDIVDATLDKKGYDAKATVASITQSKVNNITINGVKDAKAVKGSVEDALNGADQADMRAAADALTEASQGGEE